MERLSVKPHTRTRKKALQGLKRLHGLSIFRGDLQNDYSVRWFDFENSLVDGRIREGQVEGEWAFAMHSLGPDGHTKKTRISPFGKLSSSDEQQKTIAVEEDEDAVEYLLTPVAAAF